MEDSEHPEDSGGQARASLAWRKRLVVALIVVVGISIVARVSMAKDAAPAGKSGGSSMLANNLVEGSGTQGAGGDEQAQQEPSTVGKLLPFVTEGGVAMLLGIALGVATRAVFKIALIGIAVLFVAVQFLAYKGVITIDWQAMGHAYESLKNYVFNISSNSGIGQIVTHKLPSAGALGLGYMLGLKKG